MSSLSSAFSITLSSSSSKSAWWQSNSRESGNPSSLSPILQHHSKSALSSKSQNVCIDAEFRFPSLSLPDPDMPRRLSASWWFPTLWCNHRLLDRKHNLCVKVSHHKDTWTATRIHIQGKTHPQQTNTGVTHKHNLWEQVSDKTNYWQAWERK